MTNQMHALGGGGYKQQKPASSSRPGSDYIDLTAYAEWAKKNPNQTKNYFDSYDPITGKKTNAAKSMQSLPKNIANQMIAWRQYVDRQTGVGFRPKQTSSKYRL